MKKYYIYLFLDKSKPGKFIYDDIELEYEPFYVGKGTGNRIKSSLYDRESPFKVNKINKIKNSGGEIISIKLYENLENIESLELEKFIIDKIGRRDLGLGTLVNQTDGGDGRLTSPHSEATKRKISETKKSQNLSTPLTEETKNKLREINKGDKNPMFGKTHTDKIKEDQSNRVLGHNHPMFGKKHTDETILKIRENRNLSVNQEEINRLSKERNSKVILQYDLKNYFIKEYESIKVASLETGLSESLIGKTCRGIVKNPRKFIFKFKENNIMFNSFLHKIGDIILIDSIEYKLLKRNKISFVVENNNILTSFKRKDYEFIWFKK
jgi:group I intron endonuclease